MLRERVAAGGTVIMTTHILEVAERMADRIGVIAGGRLIAEGTLDELRRKTGKTAASLEDTFLTLVAEQRPPVAAVSEPATLTWLAGHELRLGWRDWVSLMTAGRRSRARTVAIALIVFGAFMHLFAYWLVAGYADATVAADTATLVGITGTLVLSWALMLSQAMESVTRAFYARSDLDLILSSPVSARRSSPCASAASRLRRCWSPCCSPRRSSTSSPCAAARAGCRAYGVVAGMGAVATAVALALTIALFRLIGAKRTRLIAQIVAAVIGAAFVIGLQIAAILSSGSISRFAVLQSPWMLAHAPDTQSMFWWPARAMLGDPRALAAVVAASFVLLAAAIALFSRRFGDHAMAAASVGSAVVRQRRSRGFRRRSPMRVLRQKEWTLLLRDPWLVSQTLMQILYLLPPALLLWGTFRDATGSYVILIPVLVMAAGQLAGGLAWLAISGEDAPDLIASAPVAPGRALRAKIEAVIGMIALVFAPIVAVLACEALSGALVAALGILAAAAAATLIQIWFRTQAKRSQFRRRQTSSRIATFAEAFSSIAWAATAALAAAGSWFALAPGAGCARHSGRRESNYAESSGVGRAVALPSDQQPDHHQVEDIGADAEGEGRRVIAEMIVEQAGEPAARGHADAAAQQ